MPIESAVAEPARAKLNLALHVRARRVDGYHEIETLFAFADYGDAVRIEPAPAPSFTVRGPFAAALAGEVDNLVIRAAAGFAEAFGGGPWAIALEKRLPVASGIGGGSADAAAALRALARLHGMALDDPRLLALAERLGSDVPACLFGRTALGRGRGERLEPMPAMAGVPVLLVNPGIAVSTAMVFAAWDGVDRGALGPDLGAARNDLEAPARAIAPVIGELLDRLSTQPGVRLARMSGSGATCFALFGTAAEAERARQAITHDRPDWWCVATRLV